MKLKTRMKLLTFVLIFIVVLLNTATIILFLSGSLKKNATQSVKSVNAQTLITFDNLLDSFETMSQLPLMDSDIFKILNKNYDDYEKVERKYKKYQDQDYVTAKLYMEMFYKNNYVYSVTIIPFNSDLVYSKQRFSRHVNIENIHGEKWYQDVRASKGDEVLLIPQMKDDMYTGEEEIISVARLLHNPMKNLDLGVMRIDIAAKDLVQIWNMDNMPEGCEVLVLDSGGNFLYSSMGDKYQSKELMETLTGSKGAEDTKVKIKGKNQLAVSTSSDKSGVRMVTFVPEKVIFADVYLTTKILFLIAFFCLLMAVIMTEGTTKGIMYPIRELSRLMKSVRAGDLTVRSKVEPNGEFGEVCESFNLMVQNTQDLIGRIYAEQTEKREMEYKALQAQISPHFTLNTINTIKWLAYLQGSKSIENALDSLSNILAFAVRETSEKITIETELLQMNYYVNILTLRYYNKFDIFMDVAEEVKNCCTLKYMLQTVVENAVFHGFDEFGERGRIHVKIYSQDEKIIYEVEDNGKGMAEEMIEAVLAGVKENDSGVNKIGIYNINRRIKLIFGQDYGVQIESKTGEFTKVTIIIPKEEHV